MAKVVAKGKGFDVFEGLIRGPKVKKESVGAPTRKILLWSVVATKDDREVVLEEPTSKYIAQRIYDLLDRAGDYCRSQSVSPMFDSLELVSEERIALNKGWDHDGKGGFQRQVKS